MILTGEAKAVERERLVLTEIKRLQQNVEKLAGRFTNIEDRLAKVSDPFQESKAIAQPPVDVPMANDLMNCNNNLDSLVSRMDSVLDRLEL